MSCIIKYKGRKYSEEQFKEYFINNKNEFATSIAKNKYVIDSFKRKMEGIDFVFSQSPELASIGSKTQYLEYLSTIFPNSKVKDIVYHGSKSKFDKFDKQYIGKNDAVSGYGFYFSHLVETADIFGEPIAALINLKNPSKKSLGYGELIDKESYEDLPLELKYEYNLIKDGNYKGYYEVNRNLETILDPNENWDNFNLRLSKAAYDNVKKKYDGVYFGKTYDVDDDRDIVVFEPEQIHILKSKQDIEGFKSFVESPTIRYSQADQNKVEYTRDLAIEEEIAKLAQEAPDEKLPKSIIGKWVQTVRNFFRNIFKEKTTIERFLRDVNQGKIGNTEKLLEDENFIDNEEKIALDEYNVKYQENYNDIPTTVEKIDNQFNNNLQFKQDIENKPKNKKYLEDLYNSTFELPNKNIEDLINKCK